MRIGLFYFSLKSNGDQRRQTIILPDGSAACIRVEQVEAAGAADALDLARFDENEGFLNSMPLDPEDWK